MFVLCLDVSFFSESLEKYNNEHEQAVGILEHRSIGMILVDCKKLKEVLIPSPLKCLEVRRAMLITAYLQSFLSAKLFSFKRVSEYISVGKQPLFRNVTGFLVKWRLRIERRNSLLMTCHYLNLSSASDWSCWVRNLHLPIKSTTLFNVYSVGILIILSILFRYRKSFIKPPYLMSPLPLFRGRK